VKASIEKIIYLTCVVVISVTSCNDQNKEKLYKRLEICDNLYLEIFKSFSSGAFGGDIHSKYVTDSVHFRLFVGTEETESEVLFAHCSGDFLIIKESLTDRMNDSTRILYEKVYSIAALKKECNPPQN
jgi:hypothetical protein